ncbi:Gfo/Idh/MocA family oxidoreductase [uncultured Christiangramia sp.]|uniref:Gfo/Idh/MocA family protein n=1 Tax=uncultured Christiangramia sp. TaxID=503836 RepID=UPI0026317E38|nr:Gfo/Idh/MocA family oxidoreductase [uncultured Christiangramia sp.]
MSRLFNLGIIGKADIALRKMVPAIQSLPDLFNLKAVARRKLSSEDQTHPFNIIEGYEQIINNAAITAVYIPLPLSEHFKWAKAALNHGKHVLVEKSMALTYGEAVELNDIARENKLVLLENFSFRFHSQFTFIKKKLNEGSIGEIRFVRSSFCIPPFSDSNKIQLDKWLGGGALMDTGCYPVKAIQQILGENLEVCGANQYFSSKKEIDMYGGAFLRQQNGEVHAHIAFGFDNHYQCNLEIVGSKGKIYTERIFTSPKDYKPVISIESGQLKEQIELDSDDQFRNILKHFHYLISHPQEALVEYSSNISQAKLLDSIKSAGK